MSTASVENKKAKHAPCKRVCENENLDSVGSTSGLVQQHASGSCSPKILRLSESETCTTLPAPPYGGEISIKRRRRRRDRERLRRLNETEEQ